MKKLLLLVAIATITFTSAQTDEGSLFLEVNTAFGAASGSNTGFSLRSDKVGDETFTRYNLGVEGGYFIMDGLAIKAGFGFGDTGAEGDSSVFSYKIGAKYYLMEKFPLQLNYNGASYAGLDENPSYVGLQGGYAWFLNDNVSIEPGLAYNLSMNGDFYENVLQFNIGFAVHL